MVRMLCTMVLEFKPIFYALHITTFTSNIFTSINVVYTPKTNEVMNQYITMLIMLVIISAFELSQMINVHDLKLESNIISFG